MTWLRTLSTLWNNYQSRHEAQRARDEARAISELLQAARRRGDTRAIHYYLTALSAAVHVELVRSRALGWRGGR